jgi:hypothetical protein
MLKHFFFCLAFLGFLSPLSAQTDLKISPVALLFERLAFSAEFGVGRGDDFGLDVDLIIYSGPISYNVSGKYYFQPKRGLDGFHIGAFAGNLGDEDSFGLGFLAGFKAVSLKRVVFEVGLGVGRSFISYGAIGYGKLHVGYRLL